MGTHPSLLPVLPTRRLGQTALSLSVLGFGAAPIGNLYRPVDEASARDAVAFAYRCGIRYFDTAPHYGFGLSEARLGAALGKRPAIVSTKVGRVLEPAAMHAPAERHGFVAARPFEPVFDYSYDGIMRSYEESLRRLAHIDILFAHDLGAVIHGEASAARLAQFLEGGYRALRRLRDEGAVGAIGLGVNEWQICEDVMARCDLDCFLLAGRYTLLEQGALDSFLPRCQARGISVIVGGPFNSGILAEGISATRAAHYNYEKAPPEIVARVQKIEAVCAAHEVAMAAAALQFPLAHPVVASVIPGLADMRQVEDAIGFLHAAIPDALWEDLKRKGLLHRDAPVPAHAHVAPAASAPTILLHPDDNVLVVRRTILPGEALEIDGQVIAARARVEVGHKIARRALARGDRIVKYGVAVGSVRETVARGEHVHTHNMKSDYIPTHLRLPGETGGK